MKQPDIEAAVCEDILARQRVGLAKYGVSVADNPLSQREWQRHLYEELLDSAIYLKRCIRDADERLGSENARLRVALELISAPMRPDGTYNRDRYACALIARDALKRP